VPSGLPQKAQVTKPPCWPGGWQQKETQMRKHTAAVLALLLIMACSFFGTMAAGIILLLLFT
jgi:hypothetical protein